MASVARERPYSQFNFQVSWSPAAGNKGAQLDKKSYQAGFQEVSGLGVEVTIAEYRAGNHKSNEPMKITGTVKTPDVTLKRGVIGQSDLAKWLNSIRDGRQDHLKNVRITLLAEDRETVAQEWELKNARPMKYTGPSLNGKGTDIAVEELVLSAESIDLLPGDDNKTEAN
ncbi:MAG: phage tail protein [Gammaproteobacteria bacterium]|nr:phage tail protein [Gammaproteobacteria bacterium]MDH5653091.1 phage tail protein [Gammaproteobacteria bacterium]